MDYDNFGALDASITAKIDGDTDFQESLATLSDDEKDTAIKSRKNELLDQEIKNLSGSAKETAKAKELADNYKKRAEKAEAEGKKPKIADGEGALSQKDLIVLMKADVAEEDIDDVVEYATFKKIPIADALKSSTVKSILAEKAEFRKTAEITAIGANRRGNEKISDATLLANASKGIYPEKGTPEAERLFWAKRKKK